MFDKLKGGIMGAIDKVKGASLVDKQLIDAMITDIQRALLSSDVNVDQVFKMSEIIRKRSNEKLPAGLSRKEHVVKVVYEELTEILGAEAHGIELKPKKILLCGLFGVGKTSCAAKLARFYQKKGLKPGLIACDTVRPAAYEQLEQLSKKVDVAFYGEKGEKDSSKVLKNALKEMRADVIIVDSSGRDALDGALIDEIKALNNILNPDEKILVIPADIGQAAQEQAQAFHDALDITDVIVTKMDATAKGGGALTACGVTGAKVKFITVGETPEDLEAYDSKKFVARLLGMPDLETLLEKVKSVTDVDKAEKIVSGDFTIEDFCEQIDSMSKMGPMSNMLEMVGINSKKIPKGMLDVQEEKMKKWKHVINSMTSEERQDPEIVKHARIERIAKGAGTDEKEVRDLIANYRKTKKMIKKVSSPGKLKRGGLGGLLKQMGV